MFVCLFAFLTIKSQNFPPGMPQPWSESLEVSAINNHDMYIKDFVFTVILRIPVG